MYMLVDDPRGFHCPTCGSFTRTSYHVADVQSVVVCPQCKRTDGPLYQQVAATHFFNRARGGAE